MDYLISTNTTKRYNKHTSREQGKIKEVIQNAFRHMRPTSINYGVVYEITTEDTRYFTFVPSRNEEDQQDEIENVFDKYKIDINAIEHIWKLAVLTKEPLIAKTTPETHK